MRSMRWVGAALTVMGVIPILRAGSASGRAYVLNSLVIEAMVMRPVGEDVSSTPLLVEISSTLTGQTRGEGSFEVES